MLFDESYLGPFTFDDEYDEDFDDDVSDESFDEYDEDFENYEEAFNDDYDVDAPYDDVEPEDGYRNAFANDGEELIDDEEDFFDEDE